jgi:hypothetical protein
VARDFAIKNEMRFIFPVALAVFCLNPAVPASDMASADLNPPTVQAWNDYVRAVETRVDAELQTTKPFLVLERLPGAERQKAATSLALGGLFITQVPGPTLLGPMPKIPDGLVHHWLGVVRIPGVRVDDVLAFVQRYGDSPRYFKDVVASSFQRNGDEFEVSLKLKREKIVTVFYNTTHRVVYRRLDPTHAASRSVAERIAELEDAGKPSEREKPVGHDSGYLWRLNSYWRFVETGDGVIVECESISLCRDIPFPLDPLLKGVVEGIARDSLEQTLGSIKNGVKRAG